MSTRATFDGNAEYHGGWTPTSKWSAYDVGGSLITDGISERIRVTRSRIGVHSFQCGTDDCGGINEPPMTKVSPHTSQSSKG